MPILPAEPDVFPDDLWQEGAAAMPGGESGRRWWCLHARPRQEKAAARHLRTHGISYYLPQVMREGRTPAGRRICSLIPLFPSYLFLLADDYQRIEALKGNHLAKVLEVADQAGLVRDLGQIHRMLGAGVPVVPDATYPIGARIRITGGPLEGLVGTVVRRRGHRDRFVAIVRFLGHGASVDLMDWQVERVEDPAPIGRLPAMGRVGAHRPA